VFNEKGIFSCATFKDDESRLIIATLSDKSLCSVQIRDYTFDKDFLLENVFGEDQTIDQIGDVVLDNCGERILISNSTGTQLKTYSIYDLRMGQNKQPL
jgi:hypothetical protein